MSLSSTDLYLECISYCLAENFDYPKIIEYCKSKYQVTKYREVVCFELPSRDAKEGQVFLFPYGTIVSWGITQDQINALMKEFEPFLIEKLKDPCTDYLTYEYGNDRLVCADDHLILPDQELMTKISCSQAISQSVKIESFEKMIQLTAKLSKELPEKLATDGKIKLSGLEIRKMMGRLFIDRHSINLHQELLDTPDFFWYYSELEIHYKTLINYLDCERRVNILNQRLTVLKELFDMLSTEVNHQHSSRLEWTIIWLIVIEVMLVISKDLIHLF